MSTQKRSKPVSERAARGRLRREIPRSVATVLAVLKRQGFEAYVVGGAVREASLGRAVADWDVATNALPRQVCDSFPRVIETGIQFGTVTVLGKPVVEVTTFRTESGYQDGRRPGQVRLDATLEQDLARRDFTFNAMALSPDWRILDPFGGRRDLERGVVCTVGDPRERFGEDGLRVMRAVRFAATHGFRLAGPVPDAIEANLAVFARVSAERKRDELWKMAKRGRFFGHGLRLMHAHGLWRYVWADFPALTSGSLSFADATFGLDPLLRWVAVAWVGKIEPGVWKRRTIELRLSRKDTERGGRLLAALHGLSSQRAPSGYDRRRWIGDLGRALAEDAARLAARRWPKAYRGFLGWVRRDLECGIPLASAELPLNGDAIRKLGFEGPQIGKAQRALLHQIWRFPRQTDDRALRAFLTELSTDGTTDRDR